MMSVTMFHAEQLPATVPIWRELFAGIDWISLKASPVYYGFGVPRGDGQAVILVPGFMGTDHYLYEMYFWLKRVGYRPYMSNIGLNANCLDTLINRLGETIAKAQTETGGKVNLIGHSLGGVLSRSAAILDSTRVDALFTLGSPIRGIKSHPFVLQAGRIVRERILGDEKTRTAHPDCFSGFCECPAVTALHQPLPHNIRKTAIYTRTDGIVDWQVCITDDPAKNFEVSGTHVGLVFNPSVYSLIARRLKSDQL